ncbi:Hypothetical protein PHPALM_16660 [Phytophthora palmivora]|uniref:Reverse transcriptase n=1 Tax=Phytophthora palmivora TaxID=4796 RepID=A0A2P4XP91_9STRA|nr:Hypothetical protein PHPALM_16660 [Phytophthora palmivora]
MTSKECGRRDDSRVVRTTANVSDGEAAERIPIEEPEYTIRVSEIGDRVAERTQRGFLPHATDDALCTEAPNGVMSENISASGQDVDQLDDRAAHTPYPTEDPECILNATYVSAMHEIAAGVVSGRDTEENDVSEHLANDIELTDYAQELAFLPDVTEVTVTALDYTGPNVQNKDLDEGQQQKLVDVLKRHEKIMISSGNALPPPAYGVVCDIDVQGHAPIKQRARRTPLRFLGKLYELLKGLLRWLRMPFGLKNAPMIYQRMIDNALWGFVQPKGGWSQFAITMREAEEQTKYARPAVTGTWNQHSEAVPRDRPK